MNERYEVVAEFIPDHRNADTMQHSQEELDKILRAHQIEFSLEGSRSYQVIVPKDQRSKAKVALSAAQLKYGALRIY